MRTSLVFVTTFFLALAEPSNAYAYRIVCSNGICEVQDAQDIGVGWGIIQQWMKPAWGWYLSDMSNAQQNYQRCRKQAEARRDASKKDAEADLRICSAGALANAVRCQISCMKQFKLPKPCAVFCGAEFAGAEAICLIDFNSDRVDWNSALSSDYTICEANLARERGLAAQSRDRQIDRDRP